MRNFLLIAAVSILCSIAGFAQTSGHLEFEGVPVNGKVDDVVMALKAKKFKQIDESSTLKGKVMGQKATIVVASTPDGSSVYLILVNCETKKSWEHVRTCFESMKMQLRLRYGDPVLYKEEFDSPLAEADPIKALQYGNCTFIDHFKAPGGEIILSIGKDAVVQIYYVDTTNAVSLY